MQREVWALHQLSEEAALSYCMVLRLDVRGRFDPVLAQDVVHTLAARHEMLRATFSADGTMVRVHAAGPVPIATIDVRMRTVRERNDTVADRLAAAVRVRHDLERGPLFSAEIIALEPELHVVLLKAHHIVCDGWSLGVLLQEFGDLYRRRRDGESDPAPAPSYAAYAQRMAAGMTEEAPSARYWRDVLEPLPPLLELPPDRARPHDLPFSSARVDYALDTTLLDGIEGRARAAGRSLYAEMLAAFALVLWRLSGTRDLVLGVPMSGQLAEGTSGLVGHCVTLLPVRIAIVPEVSFSEFAARVSGAIRAAIEHRPVSYSELLTLLRVPRKRSSLPLVSVVLTTLRLSAWRTEGDSPLEIRAEHVPRFFERYEMLANVFRAGEDTRVECQYNTRLYDDASVRGWFAMFETVLRATAADPGRTCRSVPYLPQAQLDSLARWNDTATDFDRTLGVHDLVARSIAANARRAAVVCRADTLTYAELDAHAAKLAHALLARGVRGGERVGVLLERGVLLPVALIAIWRCGAAYVPLDRAAPPERLAWMAVDAGLALIVTSSAALSATLWQPASPMLIEEALATAGNHHAGATAAAGGEAAAYVIYTSGSTGTPKGVVVPHRAVVNFLLSMQRTPGMRESDRLLAVTTLAFDISVLELLLPLCTGACTIVAEEDDAFDGHALASLLAGSGATVMQATPATWRMLLDAGWRGSEKLRAFVGGEALPAELARALIACTREVWNLYGPTETTVWSTCWRVEHPENGIRIGTPIANTRVYVLDDDSGQCAIGAAGEICIAGAGVALGYHERPELTRARFVIDAARNHEVLYRTGDRGRWTRAGVLEHRGRLDLQIKVRGFRIEPGEIEAALTRLQGIGECVVVAREDVPGDVRIVAYVVQQGESRSPQALRESLRTTLPAYMVPHHVIDLPALPRLLNGKLDRQRLPAPASGAPEPAAALAPRTPAERAIARIWSRALGIDDIGIPDNFFDLGGHSLLAIGVIADIEKETGVRLHVRHLVFESLAQIAAAIERDAHGRSRSAFRRVLARWFGIGSPGPR